MTVPNQLLGDKNTSRRQVRHDVEQLKAEIRRYTEGPTEQRSINALQRLSNGMVAGLADL